MHSGRKDNSVWVITYKLLQCLLNKLSTCDAHFHETNDLFEDSFKYYLYINDTI